MTSKEIRKIHTNLYKTQRREGIITKFVIVLLLIVALIYSYFHLKALYNVGRLGKEIKEEQIISITIISGAFFTVLLLLSKSIKFVFPAKLKSAKRKYKKDIYNLIKVENPEIIEYLPNQKIHPNEFYASGIFHTKYEDYKGDDWLQAAFRDTKITMCELRVSRLFRSIFNGLFVKCHGITKPVENLLLFNNTKPAIKDQQYFANDTIQYIDNYCKKYESNVWISTVGDIVFIAIGRNRNLFERSDIKLISNLPEDIEIFRTNFEIAKCVIRDLK